MPTEQIQYLPLDRICSDRQVREAFDEETLAGLAKSLREVGQQQPLRLRRDGDRLVIVDGERRWRAAKIADLTLLAVIIEEKELCEAEIIHRQLVANCQRQDLMPMEKARAIDRLMKETGWQATQAAAKLGFSNATVTRLLALLELPDAIRQAVESGDVPASAAYELARVDDPVKRDELAAQVAKGDLTRDGLSALVKSRKKAAGKPTPPASEKPVRITLSLGNGRTLTIAGPALTSVETLISWLEEVLTAAKRGKKEGMAVATFCSYMKDQAKA